MEIEENGKSSENYLNKWFIIQKLIKQETTIQDISTYYTKYKNTH